MRLKTRLMLVVLAVSWLPLGAVVSALLVHTESSFRKTHAAQRQAVAGKIEAQLTQTAERIDAALQRMSRHTKLRDDVLVPLKKGEFYGDQNRRRGATDIAHQLMQLAPVLHSLRLVDLDSGQVIGIGQGPQDHSLDPEVAEWARKHRGVARIRREAFNIEGQRVPRWTLQVVQVVDERLALAGAAVLDADRLDALLSSVTDGAYVALEDPEGATITATFDAGRPPSAADFDQQEQVVGGGPKGPQLGTLRLFFDRKPLERAVQKLWWTAGAAAALSALFALLVGLWTSRRLANPIERLVVAAGAIAAGARDERVPEVRGRDEVAKLTNAFNRMTHDLSESEDRLRHAERVAAWQEIARRIAHEIKNPLFPIQMSIETLQKVHERKHPDFEEVFEESTRTILEEVDRLGRIVGEFRDFARLPAPDMAPVDLSALLRSTVNLHRDVAPGVTVAWTGTDGCVVAADPDQMTAAATNLIKNAIEAHGDDPPPGARVTVDLRCSDGEVVSWTVEDNGPGMPEEVRAKLFTPYFTTKATGTGLGLAITHRIVVEHRGRIRVDSVVGRGTCFGVELPTRADE